MIPCLAAGLFVTLAMLCAWAVQRAVGNAGWVDVFWTFATGLALAGVALAVPGAAWRHAMLAAMLLLWAARLGFYVAWRTATRPEDSRYALMRKQAGQKFQRQMFWLILPQGLVSGLLAVSVRLAAAQPAPGFRLSDALGLVIFALGLGGEALADAQLAAWRARPENHGGICEAGLWGHSRHPNYFFQFLGWFAYPAIAFTAADAAWAAAFTAPAVMFLVLRFLTGVVPLERVMLAKRGPAFRDYQARVPALMPKPFLRRSKRSAA